MSQRVKQLAGVFCLVAGVAFILLGILREEHITVLQKAASICLECIGIG